MRRVLILASMLILSVAVLKVAGQAPPPPPPPLIYSPPDVSAIKEFSDTDNKFKVSFPGIPEKDTRVGEKVTTVAYKVNRKGSNSSVGIIVFPRPMDSYANELFASYREDLAELSVKAPRSLPSKVSNVVFERDIEIGGVKGREFGYEADYHFTQVAVFVVANRFYEVKTDVTNWHILKSHHPEIVKAFYAEADRFRNSFSLLK